MRKVIIVVLVVITTAACYARVGGDRVLNPRPVPVTTTVPCQEDMPCWDCETMGNLRCGDIERGA